MTTRPIVPAEIDFTGGADGVPRSVPFGDRYHGRAGAFEQARTVFLAGNGLPDRWRRRQRFGVLETGFGLGNNFLATWAAWRDDPERCERLDYVSIEAHPPRRADLQRAHARCPAPGLAAELIDAWPPLTPNLHLLSFEAGRVRLLLALGDVRQALGELVLRADALFLDGFAPASNPQMWSRDVMKGLARLCVPGTTAATWSAAAALREGLASAGFDVSRVEGFAGKRLMTVARFAPRFVARRPAGRPCPDEAGFEAGSGGVDALVIGAGLAGAAAARALADQGVECRVLEAAGAPAQASSGNPAGLFHGTLHGDDGLHARWHRAAALQAALQVAPLVRSGALAGQAAGLLRLEAVRSFADMAALLRALGLPGDYVRALDFDAASARAGVALKLPAWLYPGGGWVDPVAWVREQLRHPNIRVSTGVTVQRLQPEGDRWKAFDTAGRCVASASHVVVAAGVALSSLAAVAGLSARGLSVAGLPLEGLPLELVRGQVTVVPAMRVARAPLMPLSGDGYALTLANGDVMCGASAEPGALDAALRHADALHNLERLRRLTGELEGAVMSLESFEAATLPGRVGWRVNSADRLPVIGAMPAVTHDGQRLDQPRFLPRQRGLFVLGALGSRGIASAALGGEILAAWICGAPLPIEASLLDAVDPARGISRQARLATREPS